VAESEFAKLRNPFRTLSVKKGNKVEEAASSNGRVVPRPPAWIQRSSSSASVSASWSD
jgi:hypothetical protein